MKCTLVPLGLTTASATHATIHKKMFGSGMMALIVLNEEMNDVIKMRNSLY